MSDYSASRTEHHNNIITAFFPLSFDKNGSVGFGQQFTYDGQLSNVGGSDFDIGVKGALGGAEIWDMKSGDYKTAHFIGGGTFDVGYNFSKLFKAYLSAGLWQEDYHTLDNSNFYAKVASGIRVGDGFELANNQILSVEATLSYLGLYPQYPASALLVGNVTYGIPLSEDASYFLFMGLGLSGIYGERTQGEGPFSAIASFFVGVMGINREY